MNDSKISFKKLMLKQKEMLRIELLPFFTLKELINLKKLCKISKYLIDPNESEDN